MAVRDHTRCFRDLKFVYPVISRRSGGLSLGVNLNPDKRCNFDCVYCEVDRTTRGRSALADADLVSRELRWLIRLIRDGLLTNEPKFAEAGALALMIKDIAFSGDGEPTLIRNFSACVEAAADARRQEKLLETKIVLITNATGLDKLDVRRGLELMDANNGEVWAKLDAGTEAWYARVNRSRVRLGRVLSNLLLTARARPIVIQSLFLRVGGETMPRSELESYCDRLNDLTRAGGRISEVHAYTIARPTAESWVERLTAEELESIAAVIRFRTGLRVRTFA